MTGAATFSAGLTGTLTGGASLNLPLAGGTVTGATTFSAPGTALAVPNNATVGGTLGVTGASSFSAGLTGTLTGGASLNLPLAGGTVTGATTFSAPGTALAVPSNATVGGTLYVSGMTTIGTAGNPLTVTPGSTTGAGVVLTNTGTGGIGINPNGSPGLIVGGKGTVTGILGTNSGFQFLPGTATIANGYTPAFYMFPIYSGNYTSGGGVFPIDINAVDGVNNTSGSGFNLMNLAVSTNASTTGSVGALYETVTINGSPAMNGVAAGGTFYVTVNTPFGAGSAFGLNPVVAIAANAGYSQSLSGQETDVAVGTGNTVANKIGMSIVSLPNDQMHGSNVDVGLTVTRGAGAVGFNNGISFGNTASGDWPIPSTGSVITTGVPSGHARATAAYGVDMSAVTFSTAAFKSPGFLVNPTGAVTTTGIDNNNTLAIGPASATAINIGNGGSTTTIAGTLAVGVTALSIPTTTYTPDGSNSDYSITLTSACTSAACTLANPSNTPIAGASGVIFVTQPASGGPASFGTWGSNYQAPGGMGSITLSTAPNAVDILRYVVKDSTHILIVPSLNFLH